MRYVKSKVFLIVFVVFAACASDAWALGCSVSTTPMSMGAYNPFSASPLDSTGTVSVTCDPGVPYNTTLDPGLHSGGTFARKFLHSGGTYTLSYNLYTDAPRLQIWGDGASGTYTVTGVGSGAAQSPTVYGRVPAGQSVPSGSYADSVVVTVSY